LHNDKDPKGQTVQGREHVQSPQHHHQQAAIIALFRVVNRYVGNLAPMTGVFPDLLGEVGQLMRPEII
jgi:hypothetical protein